MPSEGAHGCDSWNCMPGAVESNRCQMMSASTRARLRRRGRDRGLRRLASGREQHREGSGEGKEVRRVSQGNAPEGLRSCGAPPEQECREHDERGGDDAEIVLHAAILKVRRRAGRARHAAAALVEAALTAICRGSIDHAEAGDENADGLTAPLQIQRSSQAEKCAAQRARRMIVSFVEVVDVEPMLKSVKERRRELLERVGVGGVGDGLAAVEPPAEAEAARTISDDESMRGIRPGSANRAKSRAGIQERRRRSCGGRLRQFRDGAGTSNQGHAGVPMKPSTTAKTARIVAARSSRTGSRAARG